jgi:hypothetical protein
LLVVRVIDEGAEEDPMFGRQMLSKWKERTLSPLLGG